MNIIGSRIDSRLVHGQVANLWIPKLQIERVIVLDDVAAESEIEKSGLRLATPMGVKLSVLPIERAARQLLDDSYRSQRLLLIAKHPQNFLKLIENGVKLETINVGNLAKKEGSTPVTNSINVTPYDVDTFEAIKSAGTHLIAQMVPGAKEEDFNQLLKKKELI